MEYQKSLENQKNQKKFKPDQNLKLIPQVKQTLRYYHYSYRTEQSYCSWIVRFVKYHGSKKHPRDMGKTEIEAFLSHLVTHGKVSIATQNQAFNAILFLYREVFNSPIEDQLQPVRSKRRPNLPVVMTQDEVNQVLQQMKGIHSLMAKLLYGGGLRLMECVRMRAQDLDLTRKTIYVRAAKGGKDRTTLFPNSIHHDLQVHLEKVKLMHERDLSQGYGEVYLPNALARKYTNAAKEFGWQYVFPGKNLSKDPRSGVIRRHHVLESGLQKSVKTAVCKVGFTKRISCHTFRHSFATHLLENGVNIRLVQELMGHSNVKTTEIYTHVMEKDISVIQSPLDALAHRERTGLVE